MAKQSSPARDRVNILYRDHETSQERELPLKILVIGDYSGQEDDRPVEDRKPVKIDRGNLGAVMAEADLRLRFNCPSKLSGDEANDTIPVDLKFASFADFGPEWVAHQVPQLRELLEARRQLTEFKDWLGNESLVFRMQKALSSPETRAQLRRELGMTGKPKPGGKT